MAQKVEDMINTVVRQIAFYSFERGVHEERRRGRTHVGADGANLDGGAGRKPGTRDRAARGLRNLSGPTFPTSSIRRSTSTPMRSAIVW